jgi:hypothetical protein
VLGYPPELIDSSFFQFLFVVQECPIELVTIFGFVVEVLLRVVGFVRR